MVTDNPRPNRPLRFGPVQVGILLLVTAAITWAVKPARVPSVSEDLEWAGLVDRYASQGKSSQNREEWLIRDFFQDERDGVFLDVGAYHYRNYSNTFYLENNLGWSGIAVEPQTQFAQGYAKYRPRTRFRAYFASDVSDKVAVLHVSDEVPNVSSELKAFAEGDDKRDTKAREVPTITLNDLLTREGIDHVDFVSIDVELAEPKVLAGFDIARFKPRLLCIEAHPEVRQEILDYFMRRNYTVVAKYLRIDPYNLYFMPRS